MYYAIYLSPRCLVFRLGGSDFHIAIFIVHHSQNKMCYSSHIYYAISISLNMYFHIKTI